MARIIGGVIKEGGWDIAIKTAVLPTAVTSEQLQCRQAGRRLFFPQPKNGSSLPNRRRSAFDFFPFPPPLGKIPFLGELGEGRKKHSSSPFPTVRSCHQQAAAATEEKEGQRERARERRSPRAMGKREGEAAAVDMLQKIVNPPRLSPPLLSFFPSIPAKASITAPPPCI